MIEIVSTGEGETFYNRDLGWKGYVALLIVTAILVYIAPSI